MKSLFTLGLVFLGSVSVSACNGGGIHGDGGSAGAGATGTGATGTGTTSTASTAGTTTMTNTCPMGPLGCGSPDMLSCPEGSYCSSVDPCGDYQACTPFPPACTATPTCACLLAQSNDDEFGCGGTGTSVYAWNNDGSTDCCP
jgi:hypothetical protein